MAFRDFLRRLGIGPDDSSSAEQGVRRGRAQSRPPDAPTIRVPIQPAAGADPAGPPGSPAILRTPPSPASEPGAPIAAPPAAPAPTAPAPAPVSPPPRATARPPAAVGGEATQYISVAQPASLDLVAVLVGIDGPLKGEIFKVQDGESKLGREGCEILLPSRRISRYHERVHHMEGAFVIEANPEVMSNNPTLLNDEEIDAEALSDGDTLQLGDCTFRFRTI